MAGNRRYDAKRDQSEPAVVEALEAAGCLVYRTLPTDLLVYRAGRWTVLEVKTATATGKIRKRKDQPEQDAFCAATNTPRVTTPAEALAALAR